MKLLRQSKFKWIVICLLCGLLFFIFYRYHSQLLILAVKLWDFFRDRHQLKRVIKSFGPFSPLVFILLQIVQVVVAPIPGEAIELLGGYVFGTWAGMLYSMIGIVLGSLVAFNIARIFKKFAVERLIPPKIMKKFDYSISHEGIALNFLLFLIPGFPKDTLCYILGLTPMHPCIFLIISTIGRIPGVLMLTFQGVKIYEHKYMTSLILLVVSALAILIFYIYNEKISLWIKKNARSRESE